MERTGVVVSTEKVGIMTAVVIKGLVDVREGQHLRRGDRIWTIVKKRWVRKPNVSVVLNPVAGTGNPEVDDSVELMWDPVDNNGQTAVADLTVETVVSFEKSTLLCVRGILPVKAGDVVVDGDCSWKVLDVTTGQPASPDRAWLSVKMQQGTHVLPMPNARLLKKA